jgi:hypothetical protein
VLVIKAPPAVLNPTIDQSIIDKAYEDDLLVARAEWGAEFRDDIAAYIDPEMVAACVSPGVRELPPARVSLLRLHRSVGRQQRQHDVGDLPPRGRAGRHRLRARAAATIQPIRRLLEVRCDVEELRIGNVQSDKYAGGWPVESFAAHGIRVEQAAKPKSELYV